MTTEEQMRLAQKAMLAYAENIAKDYKVKLDYSEESIKQVDAILGYIHTKFDSDAEYMRNSEALMGIAEAFASYIIEVIERKHGKGSWIHEDYLGFDRGAFPYTIHHIQIFPVDWCLDQMTIGEREAISNKYTSLVNALDKLSGS